MSMRYEHKFFEYLEDLKRFLLAQPLNLGGTVSSGSFGRPTGYIGYLPQTKVSYDPYEVASSGISATATLLDNMNHVRYRLDDLEGGGGVPVLTENSIPFADAAGDLTENNTDLYWNDTLKNLIAGNDSTVTGTLKYSSILGRNHSAEGYRNIVAGSYNIVDGDDNFVGGTGNVITGSDDIIFSSSSSITGGTSTVVGGFLNSITSSYSNILGGYECTISGGMSTILGGIGVDVSADYCLAYGNESHAIHDGCIVLATGSSGEDEFISNVEDEFAVRADGGFRFVVPSGTASLAINGDLYAPGMLRQARIWHAYGGFQDQSSQVTCTTQNSWYHLTNVGNNLLTGLEADGLTLSGDIMTITNAGDYVGTISITMSGIQGRDFQIRIYNITKDSGSYHIGATTTGTSNYTNITLPIYVECDAGNTLKLEIRCTSTNGAQPYFRSAVFSMYYLHD